MTLSARSIINKIDILQATVYDIQPYIIGITETWANDSILDAELQLEGYSYSGVTITMSIREVESYCMSGIYLILQNFVLIHFTVSTFGAVLANW